MYYYYTTCGRKKALMIFKVKGSIGLAIFF